MSFALLPKAFVADGQSPVSSLAGFAAGVHCTVLQAGSLALLRRCGVRRREEASAALEKKGCGGTASDSARGAWTLEASPFLTAVTCCSKDSPRHCSQQQSLVSPVGA